MAKIWMENSRILFFIFLSDSFLARLVEWIEHQSFRRESHGSNCGRWTSSSRTWHHISGSDSPIANPISLWRCHPFTITRHFQCILKCFVLFVLDDGDGIFVEAAVNVNFTNFCTTFHCSACTLHGSEIRL